MRQETNQGNAHKIPWSICPNCSVDLGSKIDAVLPNFNCPFCRASVQPVWWQRITWVILGVFLAFAFPVYLGLGGWDVFFAGLLLVYPATLVASNIIFRIMSPKYVKKREPVLTLFPR
jgi:hypothetical protein